jgi:hypothetical protein
MHHSAQNLAGVCVDELAGGHWWRVTRAGETPQVHACTVVQRRTIAAVWCHAWQLQQPSQALCSSLLQADCNAGDGNTGVHTWSYLMGGPQISCALCQTIPCHLTRLDHASTLRMHHAHTVGVLHHVEQPSATLEADAAPLLLQVQAHLPV